MRLAWFLIAFLICAMPAFAVDNSTTYCHDSSTSYINTTIYNATDNSVIFSSYQPTTCPFGCNPASGSCNPSPYDSSVSLIFLLFPLTSFIFIYFMSKLKEEDWAIHILLIGGALAMLIIPFGTFASAMSSQFYGAYMFILAIGIIVLLYYILKVIVRAFNVMGGQKR